MAHSSFQFEETRYFTDKQLEFMTLIAPHIANHLGILLDFETKNDAPSTLSTQEIRKLFGLTERECEIIFMLSTGAEDKEIVEALCISGSTFKKHLYNACKKMNVSSRTQLFNTLAAAKKSAAH